nr:hypothetical protein FFPRI1PSEUD_21990 [Pseudomonas sp. FFPRI_1]
MLQAAGVQWLAMSVDAEGLDVSYAIGQAAQARFALVTAAHQSPLGLALPRRLAPLEWAAQRARVSS